MSGRYHTPTRRIPATKQRKITTPVSLFQMPKVDFHTLKVVRRRRQLGSDKFSAGRIERRWQRVSMT